MSEKTEKPKGRKRHSLSQMADFAFDRSVEIRSRNLQRQRSGLRGYPRPSELREADILEDICHFTDAIRDLPPEVKKKVVEQLTKTARREPVSSRRDGE